MEQEDYFLINNSSDISIEVNVSTPGIAATKVFKITTAGSEEIAISANATGDIGEKIIATANTLNNNLIKIVTNIDLKNVNENLWNACFNNLVIKYTMKGGANGEQTFECKSSEKSQSNNHRFIGCEKRILLSII